MRQEMESKNVLSGAEAVILQLHNVFFFTNYFTNILFDRVE